jgi:tRNA pseudouridine32 synthase/23S rRNA pseudouridine746 synthase
MRIEFSYTPPDVPLKILHLDDQIIVTDKPEGLLSVPGKLEGRADCLISRLQAEYPDALVVHRLDCDTSGVMIFARTKKAQGFLGQEFEQRRAKKTYLARVKGEVEGESGRVDLPLCVDWPNRPRQMVNFEQGKPALTDWQVIGRSPGETRMRLMPLTGRSHQLRVHMLELGHPILGDQIYAPETVCDHPRLMLHAGTLALHHPATGEWISFTADCPF